MSPPRTQDASRLSFPLQLVIMVVTAALASYGASWQARMADRELIAAIQSDVRNINTLLEKGAEVDAEKARNLELRFQLMEAKTTTDVLRDALLKSYNKQTADFQKQVLAK